MKPVSSKLVGMRFLILSKPFTRSNLAWSGHSIIKALPDDVVIKDIGHIQGRLKLLMFYDILKKLRCRFDYQDKKSSALPYHWSMPIFDDLVMEVINEDVWWAYHPRCHCSPKPAIDDGNKHDESIKRAFKVPLGVPLSFYMGIRAKQSGTSLPDDLREAFKSYKGKLSISGIYCKLHDLNPLDVNNIISEWQWLAKYAIF